MYTGVKTSHPEPLYTLTEAEQIIDYKRARESRKRISQHIYFIKQKLAGVVLMIIGIALFVLDGEITSTLIVVLIGIGLIVTKQRVLTVN